MEQHIGSRSRLVGIDFARIIAAMLVVFYHLAFTVWSAKDGRFYGAGPNTYNYREIESLTWFGWVGVQIFFVISGYVISASIQTKPTVTSFLWSRFLRLYPAAIICSTITLTVLSLDQRSISSELLLSYLLSFTLSPLGPWIDGVYWSLGIEIAFYLSVAYFVLRRGQGKNLEIFSTIIASASCAYLLYADGSVIAGDSRFAQLLLLSHGVYFGLGCLAYIAGASGWNLRRAILFSAFMVTGVCALPNYGLKPHIVFLTVVLAMLAISRHNEYLIRNFPRVTNLITFLGPISYPLYLLHHQVGTTLLGVFAKHNVNKFFALAIVISIVCSLSIFIALSMEKALRAAIRRIAPQVAA